MKKRNPRTPEEWQDAADMAHFLLCVDSARQYGLIETDIQPDIDRCEQILKQARKRGIEPKDSVDTASKVMG